MKKIKLAALALALVCGGAGAYGKYVKRLQIYNIDPNTSVSATVFPIAPSAPSLDCQAGDVGYVCSVQAEAGLPIGYQIPSQEAIIIYVYGF